MTCDVVTDLETVVTDLEIQQSSVMWHIVEICKVENNATH